MDIPTPEIAQPQTTEQEYRRYLDTYRESETHLVEWPDGLSERDIQVSLVDLSRSDAYPGNRGMIDTLSLQSMMYATNMRTDNVAVDRAVLPADDFTQEMLDAGVAMETLGIPGKLKPKKLSESDLVGYSIVNSGDLEAFMQSLELSSLPIFREERDEDAPIVLVGGDAAHNPLLLAPFADIAIVGDGEEALIAVTQALAEMKGLPRSIIMKELAARKVPGLFVSEYPDEVTPATISYGSKKDDIGYIAGSVVVRERKLHGEPTTAANLLVARSCPYSCHFCQMSASDPYQTMPFDELTRYIDRYAEFGVDRVFITSAVASMYKDRSSGHDITDVLEYIQAKGMKPFYSSDRPEKIDAIFTTDESSGEKRAVLAPETSPRLRESVLGKTIKERSIMAAIEAAVDNDVSAIELFTIMGIPGEELEDQMYPIRLAEHILDSARAAGKEIKVEIGVGPLLPGLFTAFEAQAIIPYQQYAEHVERMREYCRENLDGVSVRTVFGSEGHYFAETFTKRGDESIGALAGLAYRVARHTGMSYHEVLQEFGSRAPYDAFLAEMPELPYKQFVRTPQPAAERIGKVSSVAIKLGSLGR